MEPESTKITADPLGFLLHNGGSVLRWLGWVLSIALLVFMTVSRDWMSVTKESAVSSNRVAGLETKLKAMEIDYAKAETVNIKFAAMDARLDDIQQLQGEMRRAQMETAAQLNEILRELRRH